MLIILSTDAGQTTRRAASVIHSMFLRISPHLVSASDSFLVPLILNIIAFLRFVLKGSDSSNTQTNPVPIRIYILLKE